MLCSWRHWKLLGHACITTDCWTNCWVLIGQKLEMVTSFFEKVTYYTTATISTRKTLWRTRWPHHYMPLCSFSLPVPAHRECARPSKINPKWAKQKSNIKTHKAMTFQLVEYIWGTATFCSNSFAACFANYRMFDILFVKSKRQRVSFPRSSETPTFTILFPIWEFELSYIIDISSRTEKPLKTSAQFWDSILQKVETKIISSQFTPEPQEENSVTKKPACDDRVMCIGTYCQLRFS